MAKEIQPAVIRKVLSMPEIAESLGLAHETARRWAVTGRIPCFRYNNKGRWHAFKEELDAWIVQQQNETAARQVMS